MLTAGQAVIWQHKFMIQEVNKALSILAYIRTITSIAGTTLAITLTAIAATGNR